MTLYLLQAFDFDRDLIHAEDPAVPDGLRERDNDEVLDELFAEASVPPQLFSNLSRGLIATYALCEDLVKAAAAEGDDKLVLKAYHNAVGEVIGHEIIDATDPLDMATLFVAFFIPVELADEDSQPATL